MNSLPPQILGPYQHPPLVPGANGAAAIELLVESTWNRNPVVYDYAAINHRCRIPEGLDVRVYPGEAFVIAAPICSFHKSEGHIFVS